MDWENLSDPLLLQCLYGMKVSEVCKASLVCQNWNRVCQDELLWKHYFIRDFKMNLSTNLPNGKEDSWKLEYKRFIDEIPIVECQDIEEHNNQVLHIAFSNNGTMFATTSKDSTIVVWLSKHPCEPLYHRNMLHYSWKCTQFSQFNSTDELLLVSGVQYGEESTTGEIVILMLEDDLPIQCRSVNRPYDLFGTWYNSEYFLTGDFHWLGQLRSANVLWLNRASQESHSEHVAVISRFCQFFNKNATSIRFLKICDVPKIFLPENVSHDPQTPSMSSQNESVLEKEESISPEADDKHAVPTVIGDSEMEVQPDKFLIFTTGLRAFTSHQIGIKVIRKYQIDTRVHVDAVRARLLRRRNELELRRQGVRTQENEINLNLVEENFDPIDHRIELNSQIIGMALSPDSRYLYVNCRSWPIDAKITDTLKPPKNIADEIDIHVIDLTTLQKVGSLLRSRGSYSPRTDFYFVFLDVSHKYVTSGSEDCNAYVWDRFHEVCLSRLPHKQPVNCAAFNPTDPEMLVSVGDDNKIKVWRSRNQTRQLNIDAKLLTKGEERRIKILF